MKMVTIIAVVLVLVVFVIVTLGPVFLKMMYEAGRAKSLWQHHTEQVTSVSVHFPVPAEIMTIHQLALLKAGCHLVNMYGGPSKKVTPVFMVTGKDKSQFGKRERYEMYAYDHGLTGADIVTEFIFWRWDIEEEVKATFKLVFPPPSVHVVVCSSPRLALLRAVWEQTQCKPETWFYLVDDAPFRTWAKETMRLSRYYVTRGLGKLRQLVVPIIDNQAV
jgi:hypothetical protein